MDIKGLKANCFSTVLVINCSFRRWTVGNPMTYGRHDAAAVDIFGQMFVIGGIGPGRSYITYLHKIYSQQKNV